MREGVDPENHGNAWRPFSNAELRDFQVARRQQLAQIIAEN